MKNALLPAVQFLSRKPYGIHSPFLYAFAQECLYDSSDDPAFGVIEAIRKDLLKDPGTLAVTDFGAGPRGLPVFRRAAPGRHAITTLHPDRGRSPAPPGSGIEDLPAAPPVRQTTVARIARRALQRPKYCRLLFRMARYFRAATVLELGTSLGITTCYLGHAVPGGGVYSLEGCPAVAGVAREVLRRAGLDRARVVTGPFHDTLPGLLRDIPAPDLVYVDGDHRADSLLKQYDWLAEHLHPDSVMMVDDIRWSRDMWRGWKALTGRQGVSLSVDLGAAGLLFFRPQLSKQNIRLGF